MRAFVLLALAACSAPSEPDAYAPQGPSPADATTGASEGAVKAGTAGSDASAEGESDDGQDGSMPPDVLAVEAGGQDAVEAALESSAPDAPTGAPVGALCSKAFDCESRVCANQKCEASRCDDKVWSGDESDVDCGGSCPPCGTARHCRSGDDCRSGLCVNNSCACKPTTCADMPAGFCGTTRDQCSPTRTIQCECPDGQMCGGGDAASDRCG